MNDGVYSTKPWEEPLRFPPDRYEGGHILVVIGGNSDTVFLADTSLWNRRELPRAQFLQWWGDFYAVVTPNEQG